MKPLTEDQKGKLLAMRVNSGIAKTFRLFSPLFLLSSRLDLPYGVAVMTSSPNIAKTELQPVFPDFYMPTLREYLDAIARQTSSEWKYDPTSKFYKSEVDNGPAENLAIFEFTEVKRPEPFKVDLPKGWKAMRQGSRSVFVPSDQSARFLIVERGSYSVRRRK